MPQPPAPVHPQIGSSNGVGPSSSARSSSTPAATDAVALNATLGEASGGTVAKEVESIEVNGFTIGTVQNAADETNDSVTSSLATADVGASSSSSPPPPPDVAERIIANLLPR